MLPASIWIYDFNHWKSGSIARKFIWFLHILMFVLGAFVTVAGSTRSHHLLHTSYLTLVSNSLRICGQHQGCL